MGPTATLSAPVPMFVVSFSASKMQMSWYKTPSSVLHPISPYLPQLAIGITSDVLRNKADYILYVDVAFGTAAVLSCDYSPYTFQT